jgi:zinc finger SWIM domain-containing protein 3
LKVKEKEIHGSERPIGGFEKATRQKKKTKNDLMASGSATEANTRRKKKGKNDPKACGPAVEADNVKYEQLHYTDQVRDFSYNTI